VQPNEWARHHEDELLALLDAGEELWGAERVMVAGRARRTAPHGLPRGGFVLVVTSRRVLALSASRWLARPGQVVAAWTYDEGIKLTPGSAVLDRLRMVMPDRSIVTLRPYGVRTIRHLAP
jgi:hypothetical protein